MRSLLRSIAKANLEKSGCARLTKGRVFRHWWRKWVVTPGWWEQRKARRACRRAAK